MNYYQKYLKYKTKYLKLKKNIEGGQNTCGGKQCSSFQFCDIKVCTEKKIRKIFLL